MSETPPLVRNQRVIDREHLALLSIFHFIIAGLAILGILFLIAHYAVMRTVLNNPKVFQNPHNANVDPQMILRIFVWLYLFGGLLFIAAGTANLLSALFIRARKHRVFSLVVAGLNCVQFPFGTALGVCTFVVLFRESVKQSYGEGTTTNTLAQGHPGGSVVS